MCYCVKEKGTSDVLQSHLSRNGHPRLVDSEELMRLGQIHKESVEKSGNAFASGSGAQIK